MSTMQPTDPRTAAFLEALVGGRAREAEQVVRDGLAGGLRPDEVHAQVIAPAMRAVGELWARDELSVADEHLATAITLRVVNVIGEASRAGAAPADGRRVLLAAPGGEQHVVGLRMVAGTLGAAGFEVYELGAQVPVEALARAVARWSPRLVGLSVTMPGGELEAALSRIRDVDPDIPVLLGGAGVPGAGHAGPRTAFCDDVSCCVATAEGLLSAA
jgi:MerR family transcriptional regulator, light-induced transcriptional regulator